MNLREELALAQEMARAAGDCLRHTASNEILSSEGKDIKLRADQESEAIILEGLAASSYAILAEESGEHGSLDGDAPVWIVDPLDGSMNYSRKAPLYCVSIALWAGPGPLLGVIYDVERDEMFSAITGEGARCNDQAIGVSAVDDPGNAILVTGFPSKRDFSADSIGEFVERARRFKKVRMLGTAALMLAWVACGRADFYMEDDIMLWDVAAGIALVQAAGGCVAIDRSPRHKWARLVRCASTQALLDQQS